jgi:arylsulfatase A-like enzyme
MDYLGGAEYQMGPFIERIKKLAILIESRYEDSLPLVVIHWIFIFLILFGYRARIYLYIQSLYPEIRLSGFGEYISLCLHYDGLTLFFTLLSVFFVIILLAELKKTKYIVLAIFNIIFIFFILFGIEFFRVYETTFQVNFTAREQFSGLRSIIDSALAEFSSEFYVMLLLLSLMAIALNFLLWRYDRGTGRPGTVRNFSRPQTGRWNRLFPAALLLASLFIGIMTDASIRTDKFAPRYKKDRANKYVSILHEFSMNPVYNLITAETSVPYQEIAENNSAPVPFSFRLSTDSFQSSYRFNRQEAVPQNKKYNIILYFFESTPYKYYNTRINGKYVIGSWHRLEKNSINFRRHYANYPLSANALMSVLASAYDLNSTDMVIQKYPDIRLRTLPEILKEHGYRTCLIHTGGLGYAGQQRFLRNRKFDTIIDYNQLIKMGPYNRQVGWGVDERAMIKPGIEFIKSGATKPFFMVFMPVNPHHPYAIPDKNFQITGEVPDDIDYRKRNWLNYLNSLYYADASLGQLVDELEREGLMDNTLFLLFADHGEAFYQHKMNYNHPLFLYEENVHVPFLIYNKKLFASPLYHDGITRHIDILPTILDILGISQNPEHEGIPALAPHREQCALLHTSWKDDYMGVVDGNWKYICRTADRIEELYDLRNDPDEKNNVASEYTTVAARYRSYLKKVRRYKTDYYERILNK